MTLVDASDGAIRITVADMLVRGESTLSDREARE